MDATRAPLAAEPAAPPVSWTHRFEAWGAAVFVARRRGGGSERIPKGTIASRRAVAALRRGGHVSLLADQKLNEGIAVPFFGRPAMTAPALALLALRFGCAILPARVERLRGARFRLTLYPPLDMPRSGDRDGDVMTIITAVNATL